MPDTPTSDAPLQPELRVSILVPLPTEPFAQAARVADVQPVLDEAKRALQARLDAFTIETRIVQPVRRKPKAAPLAALALLLLAACGVATTEPDCLREVEACRTFQAPDLAQGDDRAEVAR